MSKNHCSGEFSESETHLLRTKHFRDFHRPRRSIHSSSRLLCSNSGISGIAICHHSQKTLPVKTTKLLITSVPLIYTIITSTYFSSNCLSFLGQFPGLENRRRIVLRNTQNTIIWLGVRSLWGPNFFDPKLTRLSHLLSLIFFNLAHWY